jgi:nucleotide-binding universal stress UspA family protein
MFTVRAILHPTDFSLSSASAFEMACALARECGARLRILHVAPPPRAVLDAFGAVPAPPVRHERQALEEKLRRLQEQAPKVSIRYELEEGDAATEILRVARATRCDLIVMGTHGRTALRRLLMGSVAEQVVRQAPCPVLTVKTPVPQVRLALEPMAGEESLAASEAW